MKKNVTLKIIRNTSKVFTIIEINKKLKKKYKTRFFSSKFNEQLTYKKNKKRVLIEVEIVEINEIFTQKRQRAQSNFQRNETMTIKHDEIKTRDREIQNFNAQYKIEKKCDLKISQMQIDYAIITQLQKQKNEILYIFHNDLKIFFDIFNDKLYVLNS